MINQNLNNSTRNIIHLSTNIINNNNQLSEVNSFNQNIMTKKMNYLKYKSINKSLANDYNIGKFILYKPKLYKSKFKELSFCSQRNDFKSDMIKKMKVSEYKPIYNRKEKLDILYSIKDKDKYNNSKHLKNSQSYEFYNLNKGLNNMSNSVNIINNKRRKGLNYKYSTNNIFKNSNIYNISENIRNSNSRERERYLYKSVLFKIDNNEINFGLKSQGNFSINNFFKSTNEIKKLNISLK